MKHTKKNVKREGNGREGPRKEKKMMHWKL
jgi:hypothetical protein